MQIFHGSIRKKLVLLVLIATAPVLFVLLTTELINRNHAVKEAEKNAANSLRAIVELQRRITDSTRNLLRTIASIPEIREGNIERSCVILSTLLDTNPIYTNVILVDLEGDVIAAGQNLNKARHLNFADRKQFKEAIASKGFASGEFVVGKSSLKAIFPFGIAVLDENRIPVGAIIIGVSLEHYAGLMDRANYSRNTFFGLCDHKGIRLFRYPFPARSNIGEPIKEEVFHAARTTGGPGSISTRASDGLERIIVFEPLSLNSFDSPYMYMFMGIDHEEIKGRANAILNRLIITGLSSLALSLLISWIIGGHGIARRVEKLTMATKKFGHGETDVSSHIDYSDGEVGELAQSFDTMVSILRQREQERNEALDKLRTSEQRFREIIEDVSEISILGIDDTLAVSFWNPASEKLYGYTREEAIGKKIEDLIVPHNLKEDVCKRYTDWLINGVKIPPHETVMRNKSGEDVHVFCSPVLNETQYVKEIFCIDIDLTSLRKSEADRKQLIDQLRQSQKMEAIGTLAGGIAHDFNNLLMAMIGYSELIISSPHSNEIVRNHAHGSLKASHRARELVGQILTFSRQGEVELRSFSIKMVVKESLSLIRSLMPTTITIEEDLASGAKVMVDATQFHQVLMNLCINAFHAMEEMGDTLQISLQDISIESQAPGVLQTNTLPNLETGQYVNMCVSDNGTGIPPEIVERIFEPYFTTKSQDKGTGMGLSVVHGIIKSHGGDITVASGQGKGTRFNIYLPVSDIEEETSELLDAYIPRGHEHIMLVDDEEFIIDIGKQALTNLGYQVTTYTSSSEALNAFRTSPDKFDMVITDMTMPEMTGEALAIEILKIQPEFPIIICTGFSNRINDQKTRELGIKALLFKPYDFIKLGVLIREIFERE